MIRTYTRIIRELGIICLQKFRIGPGQLLTYFCVYLYSQGTTEAKIPAENQQEPRRTIPTRQGTPKPSSQKNKDGKVLTWLSEVEQGQSSSNTVASTTEDNIGTKIPPQKSTSITPQA